MAAEQKAGRARRSNDLGPDGERVAHNISEIRGRKAVSTYELSRRLTALGRPILPTAITKIEAGQRRVDADDLVALAVALGVNPNRLLLPVDDRNSTVALTPKVQVTQRTAWAWASGEEPLIEPALDEFLRVVWPFDDDVMPPDAYAPAFREVLDEFVRDVWPPDERLRRQHTSVRAARDVLYRIGRVLDGDDMGDKWPAKYEGDPRAALRRALNRLVAEVEDLMGDDDGQR